jgi:hypothetical protein
MSGNSSPAEEDEEDKVDEQMKSEGKVCHERAFSSPSAAVDSA